VERFSTPSVFACGLFALDTLWPVRRPAPTPAADQRPTEPSSGDGPALHPGRGRGVGLRAAAGTVVILAAFMAVSFGNVPGALLHPSGSRSTSGYHLALTGAKVLEGSTGFSDRYRSYRREYARLSAMIPRSALVLSAVERPALLDMTRYRVATLDIPGAVSPAPHLPYFEGTPRKVAYLRHLGFTYIVAEPDRSPGLYHDWHAFLRSTSYFRRAYAIYFADWQSTVNTLERSGQYQVRYAGDLALIRIG